METKGEKHVGADIVEVSFPHEPPEKTVGKYVVSKLQNEKQYDFPFWDKARTGPAFNMVLSRRHLLLAENNLQIKRDEYIERRVVLDAEWKDLEEKEENLRRSFVVFHKFVKENKEKKERAKRRITEEELKHKIRDEEVAKINRKIAKMTRVRDSLIANVDKLQIFEDYLSKVVEDWPEFKSITNVLSRFDALSTARTDLISKQTENLEELEMERFKMIRLIEERTGAFMGLNNTLADLQLRYEKSANEALHWERVAYRVKSRSSNELLRLYLVQDSIWNLYQQICKRKGVPIEIRKHQIEEQLLYIKGTIKEYKKITKIANKKTEDDADSVATNSDRTDKS